MRGRVAARLGPHHGAGLPQRARARAAGRGLALGAAGAVPARARRAGARAAGGLARAARAARRRLPPAARAPRLQSVDTSSQPCTCISSIVFGAFTYHINGSATKKEYIIRDP